MIYSISYWKINLNRNSILIYRRKKKLYSLEFHLKLCWKINCLINWENLIETLYAYHMERVRKRFIINVCMTHFSWSDEALERFTLDDCIVWYPSLFSFLLLFAKWSVNGAILLWSLKSWYIYRLINILTGLMRSNVCSKITANFLFINTGCVDSSGSKNIKLTRYKLN